MLHNCKNTGLCSKKIIEQVLYLVSSSLRWPGSTGKNFTINLKRTSLGS